MFNVLRCNLSLNVASKDKREKYKLSINTQISIVLIIEVFTSIREVGVSNHTFMCNNFGHNVVLVSIIKTLYSLFEVYLRNSYDQSL